MEMISFNNFVIKLNIIPNSEGFLKYYIGNKLDTNTAEQKLQSKCFYKLESFSDIIINCEYTMTSNYNIKKVVALLNPAYNISFCSHNYQRQGYFIIINTESPINNLSIVYKIEVSNLTENYFSLNSGWLFNIIYPYLDTMISLSVDNSFEDYISVYGGIQKKNCPLNFNNQADVCLISKKNNDYLMACIQNGKLVEDKNFLSLFIKSDINIERELDSFNLFFKDLFDCLYSVTIVESVSINSLAISNERLILFYPIIKKRPKYFLNKILYHEIIHQIVGIRVKFCGYGGEWLKESLTEYIQFLYLTQNYSQNKKQEYLQYYQKLYIKNKTRSELPISECFSGISESIYRSVICGKGFYVIRTLLYLISDDHIKILKEIFKKLLNINKRIDICLFKQVIEELYNIDLNCFFDEWVQRKGAPNYVVNWNYDNCQLSIKLIQKKIIYTTPIDIKIIYKNITWEKNILKPYSKVSNFLLKVDEEPLSLIIDPDKKMLVN